MIQNGIASYEDVEAALRGRSEKRLGRSARLLRLIGDGVAVRLYATPVVVWRPDDSCVLSSGGWRTLTTRRWILKWGPKGLGLYSDGPKGWRLVVREACGATSDYRFADGMIVYSDGRVEGAEEIPRRLPDACPVCGAVVKTYRVCAGCGKRGLGRVCGHGEPRGLRRLPERDGVYACRWCAAIVAAQDAAVYDDGDDAQGLVLAAVRAAWEVMPDDLHALTRAATRPVLTPGGVLSERLPDGVSALGKVAAVAWRALIRRRHAAAIAAGEDPAVAEDLAALLEIDDRPVQMLVLAAPRSDARRLALDVRYCLEGK